MADGAPDPSGHLAVLRHRLTALLSAHLGTQGESSDAYFATAGFHPMAAGKYISALVELHAAGLLSDAALAAQARVQVERLAHAAVSPPPGVGGSSWGLGFVWLDLPADEPYLITSAIVTRALLALSAALPHDAACKRLAEDGKAGLLGWCQQWRAGCDGDAALSLPAYSRAIKRPIFNAAAMAWSVVAEAAPEQHSTAQMALLEIWERRLPGLGWRYEPGHKVVDLVHQCYLYGSMLCAMPPSVVAQDLETAIGQFAGCGEWADAVHILEAGDHASGKLPWVRACPPFRLSVIDSRPARLWSLGELLGLLSSLAASSDCPGPWLERASAIADVVRARLDSQNVEAGFARHTMHAAHGLARYLRMRRGRKAADGR